MKPITNTVRQFRVKDHPMVAPMDQGAWVIVIEERDGKVFYYYQNDLKRCQYSKINFVFWGNVE